MKIQIQHPINARRAPEWEIHRSRLLGVGFMVLFLATALGTARGQEERKKKIPVVDKITSGASQQAFTGKVEELDLEHHVLEVNTTEGKSMEIFPIKKGPTVTSASGERMKLDDLKKGTNVIVYFEVKSDRRTVKKIVVLSAAADEDKKKTSPPS